MQYGNSPREPEVSDMCGRFKSYYVVWKRISVEVYVIDIDDV